nr:MAG TPA: hypothetical protein [Caudoviricetes sp.]
MSRSRSALFAWRTCPIRRTTESGPGGAGNTTRGLATIQM